MSLHAIDRVVAFHDTDPAGVAHFTAALRWMEECEHGFLRQTGLAVLTVADGLRRGWPRVAVQCDYRSPLRSGEQVRISLVTARVGGRSLEWRFALHREAILVAEGSLTVVHAELAAEGAIRVLKLPAELLAHLPADERSSAGDSP